MFFNPLEKANVIRNKIMRSGKYLIPRNIAVKFLYINMTEEKKHFLLRKIKWWIIILISLVFGSLIMLLELLLIK